MWRSNLNAAVLVFLFLPTLSAQDLAAGHVEARFLGGANYSYTGSGRAAAPSYSIEGAFGVSRFVALTGSYTHDGLPDSNLFLCFADRPSDISLSNCTRYTSSRRIHEFMGGVRVSAINRTRFTPYVQMSLGTLRQTTDSLQTPQVSSTGGEITRFGVAPGLGVDVKLTRHFGIAIDARSVKAIDFHWLYRTTGGVFVRF
jgi:hypothetical protein